MQPTPVIPVLAPSSAKATSKPASVFEHYIGLQTAGAAAVLLETMAEYADRGVTPATKDRVGTLLAELCWLQQCSAGYLDFDVVARERGVAVLRANDILLATAEWAVTQVLDIVRKVVRDQLN